MAFTRIARVNPNFEVVPFGGLRAPEAAMAGFGVSTRPPWT